MSHHRGLCSRRSVEPMRRGLAGLVLAAAISSAQASKSACVGALDVDGLSGASTYVSGGGGSVFGDRLTLKHNSGFSIMNSCEKEWSPYEFTQLRLLGRTLSFDVDLSAVGCACNLAFYLIQEPARTPAGLPSAGECSYSPYYCDANQVCGQWCPELDVMEANTHALAATPHKCDSASEMGHYSNCDRSGCGQTTVTLGGNVYGPGSNFQINTLLPFTVSATFHGDELQQTFTGITTRLQQGAKEVVLRSCDGYTNGMAAAMAEGMAVRITYWGSDAKTMQWLDEPPCGKQKCGGSNAGNATISRIKVTPAMSVRPTPEEPPSHPVWAAPPTPAPWVETKPPTCAVTRKEDCSKSQCCLDPGMQCYEKNQYWAACEVDCTPGIDPRDREANQSPWSCKPLGVRSAGQPLVTTTSPPLSNTCSETRNGDCSKSQCCQDPGMQCFEKDASWAMCQFDCTPGVDPRDDKDHQTPWTCNTLGERTPFSPDWTTRPATAQHGPAWPAVAPSAAQPTWPPVGPDQPPEGPSPAAGRPTLRQASADSSARQYLLVIGKIAGLCFFIIAAVVLLMHGREMLPEIGVPERWQQLVEHLSNVVPTIPSGCAQAWEVSRTHLVAFAGQLASGCHQLLSGTPFERVPLAVEDCLSPLQRGDEVYVKVAFTCGGRRLGSSELAEGTTGVVQSIDQEHGATILFKGHLGLFLVPVEQFDKLEVRSAHRMLQRRWLLVGGFLAVLLVALFLLCRHAMSLDGTQAPLASTGALQCSFQAARDCVGTDISNHKGYTLEGCCELCKLTDKCTTFTLAEFDGSGESVPTCYLKSTAGCSHWNEDPHCTAGVLNGVGSSMPVARGMLSA